MTDAACELVCDASAPARARRWVADVVSGDHRLDAIDELMSSAQLCVSELVTNALQAGSPTVRLRIEASRGRMRLVVEDDADGLPRAGRATAHDVSGRGLSIVGEVASRWGVSPLTGGKAVWAVFE